jgi:putative ABC transport system ATP-binding protein
MTQPLIQCQNLTKIYPLSGVEVHALRGLNLKINSGEMVAIMGASGSGKSTLMHIIGCMDKQTSGKILLDGIDLAELDESELAGIRNTKLGFVFQRYNLLSRSTALYNVELPLLYAGQTGAVMEKQAADQLAEVGLQGYEKHWPNQMSGGQQQRVAIARAVINKPLVVLADEPTGALDTVSSAEVMGIFQNMHRKHGVTVVIVTHEPFVADFCQRKVVMCDGVIIDDQPVTNRTIANLAEIASREAL